MYRINGERRAIVFYATNLDILDVFPEEVQQEMVLWILEFGFTGQLTACPTDIYGVLRPILFGIQTQRRRYNNIELFCHFIFEIEGKLSEAIDDNEREAMENAIKILKKGIVRCKKRDIPPLEAKKFMYSIFANNIISKHLGVTEEWLNKFLPEEEKIPRPSKEARPLRRTEEDWNQYVRDLRKT